MNVKLTKPLNLFFFDDGETLSFNGREIPDKKIIQNCIDSLIELISMSETEVKKYNSEVKKEPEIGRSIQEQIPKKITKPVVGYVYLYKQGKYYKIGKSLDQDCRQSKYVTENPREIRLINKWKCTDYTKAESLLHKEFIEVNFNREWFILKKTHIEDIPKIINKYLI